MTQKDGRPQPRPPKIHHPPSRKAECYAQNNTTPGRLATAFWWLSLSVDLVPLQPCSKHKVRGFGVHAQRIFTPAAARFWWGNGNANLGIVLGGLPGLMCLDFDERGLFEAWRSGPGADVNTRIEHTPRGAHVFFVTTRPPAGQPVTGLEVKTSGVIVAAPSTGEGGAAYTVISAGPITAFRANYLPPAFFSLSKALEVAASPVLPKAPNGRDLITAIKQARPVEVELARLFPDVELRGPGSFKRARCPFHHDAHASFWVNIESNLWGCLANSCPYSEANSGKRAHDVINLYAAARGLTTREAIKTMGREVTGQ